MNNDTNSEARSLAVLTVDVANSAVLYLAKYLTPEQLKYWQQNKKGMHAALRATFQIPDDPFSGVRLDWQAYYKKRHGWNLDFSEIVLCARW